jgi:hypothetical protein
VPWDHRTRPSVYPSNWEAIRKQWAARHRPDHLCVRCGRKLGPMGRNLHLDHDDVDRSIIRGFAHGRCNVRAAAIKGNRIQRGLTPRPVRSRKW